MRTPSSLSIIVPVLNDAAALRVLAPQLAPLQRRGAQVIVVDGGSGADVAQAAAFADVFMQAQRGRGHQLAAGAGRATGEVVWFLHADSVIPDNADRLIADALASAPWGRFDVAIAGDSPPLKLVAATMNLRSRLTGIGTGDQGVFMTRAFYERSGGFASIALMEDIDLSRRLRKLGRPVCLRHRIVTSARKWERHGIARTIASMWWLRLRFWFGADPAVLYRSYYGREP